MILKMKQEIENANNDIRMMELLSAKFENKIVKAKSKQLESVVNMTHYKHLLAKHKFNY